MVAGEQPRLRSRSPGAPGRAFAAPDYPLLNGGAAA